MSNKNNAPPATHPPAGPPRGPMGGRGPCCACSASGPISRSAIGEYYFGTYDWYDPADRYVLMNDCEKIAVNRTATGGTVEITKSFSLSFVAGGTASLHESLVKNSIGNAMTAWTAAASSYRVVINETGCPTQRLVMRFEASFVPAGADITIRVDATPRHPPGARPLASKVVGDTMTFFINGANPSWTMIHEVGHTFGLPDEYTTRHPVNSAPSMTYIDPTPPNFQVTLSSSRVPPEPGKFAFDNGTVMGQFGNTVYPIYLFYWVAIEVRAVLRKNGITADVDIQPA